MFNKTLVCVLAETRASALSWNSFKRNVLDELNADLAVCIAVPDKYDYGNPFWQHAKHRFTCKEFENFGDAFDLAQAHMLEGRKPPPDWRSVLAVKDQWLGGVKHTEAHPGSAAILIFFRWFLLFHLRESNLLLKYDRFVVTRSDFIWECPHPPLAILGKEFIWFPDGEQYGGVTDRHAVLCRNNVEDYLAILEPILLAPDVLKEKMRHRADWNLEKYIYFSLNEAGYKDRLRFFPYIMYACREWAGTTRWSKGQWSDELGYYIKYQSEYDLAVRHKTIFQSQQDWFTFFRDGQDGISLS